MKVLLAGPYATNFSYARINRGLALALAKHSGLDVKIWKNPSFKIDWIPEDKDLNEFPGLKEVLTDDVSNVDVLLYCNYPSGPADTPYGLNELPGKTKILWVPWEETVFPKAKAEEINKYAHGVMTISSYCKNILASNGIDVPIEVVPCALDDQLFTVTPGKFPINTTKSFKFMHLSTAKQRKGVDVLLKAYYESFTASDDVSLVIKSFPSPVNMVNTLLGQLDKEYPNHPEVIHLNDPHLTEQQIADLNNSVDAAVYPARVEGFGIPIAEAMYFKLPTIVTGYSGQMDFVNNENALVLDYKLQDAIESEAVNLGAKWAETDLEDLKAKMKYVYEHRGGAELKVMTEKAHLRASELTWDNASKSADEFIQQINAISQLKSKKIAVLTTQNTVCGVAEYSRDLYSAVINSFADFHYLANSDVADRVRPDQEYVERVWEYGEQKFDRTIAWLDEHKPDIFHIQLHSAGHFPLSGFTNLVSQARKKFPQMKIFVTPHTVKNSVFDLAEARETLKLVDKTFVHNAGDLAYLKNQGVENLELFILPYPETPVRDKAALKRKLGLSESTPIVMTHGLASFHKGILETAEAIHSLKRDYPNVLWIAANAVNPNNSTSAETIEKLREQITQLQLEQNVILITDFLNPEQIMLMMQSADVAVNAYSEVGESASAVIRKYLATALPTIVSDIPMMSEYTDEVLKIANNSTANIEAGIRELLNDKAKYQAISKAARAKASEYSWSRQAVRMLKSYL